MHYDADDILRFLERFPTSSDSFNSFDTLASLEIVFALPSVAGLDFFLTITPFKAFFTPEVFFSVVSFLLFEGATWLLDEMEVGGFSGKAFRAATALER